MVAFPGAHDEWLVIISSPWPVSDIIVVQASQRERILEHNSKSE